MSSDPARRGSVRLVPTAKLDPCLPALREDPDAVHALAFAYESLAEDERQAWLDRLASGGADSSKGAEERAPTVALYAPLLAVETDERRRAIIIRAISKGLQTDGSEAHGWPRALCGSSPSGKLAVLVLPLYLNFVQVLICTYLPRDSIVSVHHEPIVSRQRAPRAGNLVEGAQLSDTPVTAVVDDLAATIVAHVRSGLQLPDTLQILADLFGVREEPLSVAY